MASKEQEMNEIHKGIWQIATRFKKSNSFYFLNIF